MSECPFESDVLDALASRRWPSRADEELLAHVAQCSSCADLAEVAGALLNDESAAFDAARVPSSASVWHRAQLRAREEAVRAAARPIGFVQGLAFSSAIAVAIAAVIWGAPILYSVLPDWSAIRLPSVTLPTIDLEAPALLSNTAVQLGIGAGAILASLGVYLALRESN
jgi:hypothetical protein